jgi:SAM-dependent methyltransferase
MGDRNQLIYLQRFVQQVDGPVLEVGSREYGSTSSFRAIYTGEYVGVDMSEGPGVDVVADLTGTTAGLGEGRFALAICCSVLEHVRKPWRFAENLTRLVRPGGQLYISVPWVWRYHPYPDDYFRFSARGVESLFEDFEWGQRQYSTSVEGEFIDLESAGPHADELTVIQARTRPDGPARTYLPYLMVNMLGRRRG